MDIETRSFIGGGLDAARHTNKAIFPLSSIAFAGCHARPERRMFCPRALPRQHEFAAVVSTCEIAGVTAGDRG
jgi:hypothetical protein